MSATPATHTKVDVRLSHACHAKRRWMWDCATPATQSAAASRASRATKPNPSAPLSAMSATPATRNEGGCEIAPRLPRKTKVDVRLCHACHAKRRWMWVCATLATQNEGGCEIVPRLPRKVPRASRATKPSPSVPLSAMSATPATRKWRWMWVCATPATQNEGGCEIAPTPATQSAAAPTGVTGD